MRAHEKTRRLTGLALMTAIVIVLQLVASALVKVGVFAPTLTLAPILIGAAIYGPKAGAYLGGVFGVVVTITCIIGWDAGRQRPLECQPLFDRPDLHCQGEWRPAWRPAWSIGLSWETVWPHGRMIAGSVAAALSARWSTPEFSCSACSSCSPAFWRRGPPARDRRFSPI